MNLLCNTPVGMPPLLVPLELAVSGLDDFSDVLFQVCRLVAIGDKLRATHAVVRAQPDALLSIGDGLDDAKERTDLPFPRGLLIPPDPEAHRAVGRLQDPVLFLLRQKERRLALRPFRKIFRGPALCILGSRIGERLLGASIDVELSGVSRASASSTSRSVGEPPSLTPPSHGLEERFRPPKACCGRVRCPSIQ